MIRIWERGDLTEYIFRRSLPLNLFINKKAKAMEKKHQVHNLIILDESGSMLSIRENTIEGFNEIVQTTKGIEIQFPEQEHYISLISFNGLGTKILHFIDPVSKLEQIDDKKYNPDASTPLYDAMGFALNKLHQVVKDLKDYNVLVTVFTDGEENASREFSGEAIKKLVEKLTAENWTFTYIGTDHDVENFAMSISINNSLFFSKSEEGLRDMFVKERSARVNYSRKIRDKENTAKDFYDDDKDGKKNEE
jgi:Mg-chelatase subunit ChlD